jgi:hypothetical protein
MEAFNRQQRSERAAEQRTAKNDGMKDLENAYKKRGSGQRPPMKDGKDAGEGKRGR